MDISPGQRKAIKQYYLQDKIVDEMMRIAKHREFSPTYPRGYGKRPDSVNYAQDFRQFVEKGAIAFHGSVERWNNPLLIDKIDLEKLRNGWDLVIDIDADEGLSYAKQAALALIDELTLHGIAKDSISVKFSGNRGFHLGVRQEAFPDMVGGTELAELYPRLPQAIVGYLRDRIKDRLAENFRDDSPEIARKVEEKGPFAVADVENDWGKRHLFRLPYSVNEKTIGGKHGILVSKPLSIEDIEDFKKDDARMDKIEVNNTFLDSFNRGEAADLAVEAIDWLSQQESQEEETKKRKDKDYDIPDEALAPEHFPKPIKRLLSGLEDGRKRALFILATFLRHVGYSWDDVEKEIWEWNDRNKEPLRDNYIKTQLQWHRNQDEPLMPPNFDAKGWYHDIGVLDEDEDQQMLDNFDNPVPYASVLKEKSENRDEKENGSD